MIKIVASSIIALAVGLVVGIFVGRYTLERHWSSPFVQVAPGDAQKSAAGDANPTPRAGTRIVKTMPIGRTRKVLRELTAKDPVVATTGAIGADDTSVDLHLVLENRGACKVTSFEGVAYAFDSYGRPAKANRSGESYFAFAGKDPGVDPGESTTYSQPVKHVDTATLVVAQVDSVGCADGTSWARP